MSQLPGITSVDVHPFRVPTDAPEADGTAQWDTTTGITVQVHAGDVTGVGYSYTAAAAAAIVRDDLAPAALGRSLAELPRIVAAMRSLLRNPGLPGIGACALSALDIALWDAKARALDLPLVDLLGRTREAAAAYGSGGFTTYDDSRLRDQLVGFVHHGCRAVKIKIGQAHGTRLDRDLHRVAIAREAIGTSVELFVDANGAYAPGQARQVERALREWDVHWFEEPVSSDDPAGLAAVRAAAVAEIAAGEYVYRAADAVALLGAVDVLQLDVTRCGGITGWLSLAALADAHGLPVSAHCAPQLSAHLGCVVPNFRHLEYFHDHVRVESALFENSLPLHDGTLTPNHLAGHGLRLRADHASA